MQLIALRPLSGTNVNNQRYRADPGQQFEVNDRAAEKLMARGVARLVPKLAPTAVPAPPAPKPQDFMPVVQPESKAVTGYENKMVEPAAAKAGRGRPSQPTPCPKCGTMCGSARKARNHQCEE